MTMNEMKIYVVSEYAPYHNEFSMVRATNPIDAYKIATDNRLIEEAENTALIIEEADFNEDGYMYIGGYME